MDIVKDCVKYLYQKWNWNDLHLEEEESVEGKIVLITGADGGIGKCIATELASRGAKVIMACLSLRDGERAIEEIRKRTGLGELILHQLNLADLDNVRDFAKEIIKKYPHINILINNAGIGNNVRPLRKTKDGLEEHMAINFFGHFLLTNLLLGHIKKGKPSRILFTASTLHLLANLDLNDLNFDKAEHESHFVHPYGNSKLCMMLFAQELAEKLKGSGITTYSYCPGVVDTPIFDNCTWPIYLFAKTAVFLVGHGPEKGCKVAVYTAIGKQCKEESGKMYRNQMVWDYATQELEKKKHLGKPLWEKCEKLVGLKK